MVSDIDLYRMIRYFTILTHEHYELLNRVNKLEHKPLLMPVSLEEIMQNVCKDFGLPYEAVLEHSKLEPW